MSLYPSRSYYSSMIIIIPRCVTRVCVRPLAHVRGCNIEKEFYHYVNKAIEIRHQLENELL